MRLLVAEADASLAEFLQTRLQQEHFAVQLVTAADQFSRISEELPVDLILLDLGFPGLPGTGYLRPLRDRWPDTPILLLSEATSIEERVKCLDAGADDIVTIPFAWLELAARIRAVLRRRNGSAGELLVLEDLVVNRVSHQVRRAGHLIKLSPREYALLEFLLRSPGRPVTRAAIVEEVWRIHGDSITNVVDVYINYLRRKIDAGVDCRLIHTIRGVGYQIGGSNHLGR